jgi:hypothetical protein
MGESIQRPENESWLSTVLVPAAICAAALLVFMFAVNPTLPWESDQSAKAAQILEIVDAGDYFFSAELPDYYRIRQLPLYYFLSSVLYKLIGGSIFTFMNVSSVVLGAITVLALAYAVRNAFGIHPFWSTLVLLAMPLVVIISTYGNETSWAFGFFALSLLMLTSLQARPYYGAAVAFGCAIACRLDMMLLFPYWLLWGVFGPPAGNPTELLRRVIKLCIVLVATILFVWVLLVRTNPLEFPERFWTTSYLLVASFLSYPFNPSVVLIAFAGWIMLCKSNVGYAVAHLLLLLPLGYYFGTLSTPKYIMVLCLFYGIPAAYLLDRANRVVRTVAVAAILLWMVIGVSNFGVFGPREAKFWYVPTADGPCPIGGYVDFYEFIKTGFYQSRQEEYIDVAGKALAAAAEPNEPGLRLAGDFPWIALPYNRVLRRRAGLEHRIQLPEVTTLDDTKFLMVSWGLVGIEWYQPQLAGKIRGYLENGQIRPHAVVANEDVPFPDLVEVGEHVPAGTNPVLGKRFLFMMDYYRADRPSFRLPMFVEAYKSTTWFKPSEIVGDSFPEPVYRDEQYAAYDRDLPDGRIIGLIRPAAYNKFQPKRPDFGDSSK